MLYFYVYKKLKVNRDDKFRFLFMIGIFFLDFCCLLNRCKLNYIVNGSYF